jgi:hypothetical protein
VGGTGGGGNGALTANTSGSSGSANTGGGGGGGNDGSPSTGNSGGSGGSGVVILRYPDAYTATFSGGVTQTTSSSGGFKVSIVTATSTTSETVSFS